MSVENLTTGQTNALGVIGRAGTGRTDIGYCAGRGCTKPYLQIEFKANPINDPKINLLAEKFKSQFNEYINKSLDSSLEIESKSKTTESLNFPIIDLEPEYMSSEVAESLTKALERESMSAIDEILLMDSTAQQFNPYETNCFPLYSFASRCHYVEPLEQLDRRRKRDVLSHLFKANSIHPGINLECYDEKDKYKIHLTIGGSIKQWKRIKLNQKANLHHLKTHPIFLPKR